MLSALVIRALEGAGLLRVLELRREQRWTDLQEMRDIVERADWILVGALADHIRENEVGSKVSIVAGAEETPARERGLAFLRRIAMDRIFSPHGASIGVSFDDVGLELAQVALSFGASELRGQIRNKAGESIASDELGGVGKKSKRLPLIELKKRELGTMLSKAGRSAEFIEEAR